VLASCTSFGLPFYLLCDGFNYQFLLDFLAPSTIAITTTISTMNLSRLSFNYKIQKKVKKALKETNKTKNQKPKLKKKKGKTRKQALKTKKKEKKQENKLSKRKEKTREAREEKEA
jgi:hypothetical protein